VDTDDEEDEDAYRDYADDALDPNEAEEAGQTAADIEARMRQRDRMGHHDDQLDEEAIENYYRNRYNEDTAAIARYHFYCFSKLYLVLLSPGLWTRIRIRIGSGFSDFVDPDPYWESGSRGKKMRTFQWKNALIS
jgi:hypothetical protein